MVVRGISCCSLIEIFLGNFRRFCRRIVLDYTGPFCHNLITVCNLSRFTFTTSRLPLLKFNFNLDFVLAETRVSIHRRRVSFTVSNRGQFKKEKTRAKLHEKVAKLFFLFFSLSCSIIIFEKYINYSG